MAATDPYASIHDAYVAHGARGYYEREGRSYRNPHEPIIHDLIGRVVREWPLDTSHVLDLAAGSGEVTLALRDAAGNAVAAISAIDPFTADAYTARTGSPCERLTFEAIADGALAERTFSLVVCSFAMHLVEASRLPALCWALARAAPQLLILTPHKRPVIKAEWNWTLQAETLVERVRARLYTASLPAAAAGEALSPA